MIMGMPSGKSFYIKKLSDKTPFITEYSHLQDYHEIYFLTVGQRRYFINHTIYTLNPGDTAFISKGDIRHAEVPDSSSEYEMYIIGFSAEFLDNISLFTDISLILHCFDLKKIHIPGSKIHSFISILDKLYSEYTDNDPLMQSLAFLHTAEILVTLCQMAKGDIPEMINESNIPEERIQNACRYICNYYNRPITLDDMSKIAFMSPTYFSKKFKKVTGFGFNEYLNNVRVKIAANMLIQTKYSITDIAFFCGYKDSNYFGDVFKKIMGMSPREYRKKYL